MLIARNNDKETAVLLLRRETTGRLFLFVWFFSGPFSPGSVGYFLVDESKKKTSFVKNTRCGCYRYRLCDKIK